MKDKRGVELEKGQNVIFSMRTGGFGAHEIKDATVVNITPKMVRVGYTYGRDNTYVEGNYNPKTVIVADLPDGATHTPAVVDPVTSKINQFKADLSTVLEAHGATLDGATVVFEKTNREYQL